MTQGDTPASGTPRTELRDRILKERKAGRIVFWGLPDELLAANLDDFLKQPADGILYDLNRLEEVVLTFLDDPKWVNDFAVATVIRRLVAELQTLRARDGYVLVPREPTEQMKEMGANAYCAAMPEDERHVCLQEAADACYRAMLSNATPTEAG